MNPSESEEYKAAEELFRSLRVGTETVRETYERVSSLPTSMAQAQTLQQSYAILNRRRGQQSQRTSTYAGMLSEFTFRPGNRESVGEDIETELPLDAGRKRKIIPDEGAEERRKRLARERQQRYRDNKKASENSTQRRESLAAEAERLRNLRDQEMPTQTSQRLAAVAVGMRNVRDRETEAEAESRRQADAERHSQMRARRRENDPAVERMRALQQVDSEEFDETLVAKHDCGPMNQVCRFCGAFHFEGERTTDGLFPNCCNKGKTILPVPCDEQGNVLEYPEFLRSLMSDPQNVHYKNFRENIRSYNSSVSFASMGAKIVEAPGRGPYCFKVNGSIYHRTSHLAPVGGYQPQYAQLYVLDSTQATDTRTTHNANVECIPAILDQIDRFLRQHNRLCQTYRLMRNVMEREAAEAQRMGTEVPVVHMVMRRDRELDSRRYNLATENEVAMVFVNDDGEPPFQRDIRVYEKNPSNPNYPFIHLSVVSPNLDPMTYAILYPYGEPGWHDGLVINNKRISLLKYKAYQTATRSTFNPVMSAGKLTQQWVVDSYLQVEANNLNYIRTHQANLRRDLYKGLHDYVHSLAREQGIAAGVPVILPSTFSGSPRNMRERLQDALAIFAKFGAMDAFITFTANPKWDEITSNLRPGETASDRPRLVATVFKLKLKALIKDITENGVLGRSVAWVYTIEFQKRGLPHAHIIVVFKDEDKFTSAEKIDSLICAEIPDPVKSPRLYEIVTRCMLHGPCGESNMDASCMENGKCSKKFPKDFQDTTVQSADGYPKYRRRPGRFAFTRNNVFTNRHVVPYNKYLTLKYDCHINVEACTSIRAVKYIYKYIYKGFDCARVVIGQGNNAELIVDEISNFIDTRYVSAPEAMWRLLKYQMHDRSHAIIRLAVHLEREQTITFRAGREEEALRAAESGVTTLTDWFRLNREDSTATQFLYPDIPYHFVFRDGKWKKRERQEKIIPRMYTVSIREEERFYLRMLLLHVRGATSYENVRTVNGTVYETFKSAAIARHLLASDVEWRNCLFEAAAFRMPPQLRQQFAFMCIFGELTAPVQLWEEFIEDMIMDYRRDHNQQTAINLALLDIQQILRQHRKTVSDFGLPVPDETVTVADTIDLQQLTLQANDLISTLNVEQRNAFDEIVAGINGTSPTKTFYINGPGGSGKTYLYSSLITYMESKGKKVESFATTGIAATLMKNGRTTHSGFGIPLNADDTSVSKMDSNSVQGRNLILADLILIDEVSMMTKHSLRVINNILQRLMKNNMIFGGKVFVVGGDFRQILPVVRGGRKADILETYIKQSPLWRHFKELSLISNMRSVGQSSHNDWLLKVGNGSTPRVPGLRSEFVEIPRSMVLDNNENMIEKIFTDNVSNLWEEQLASRVILCSTNQQCLEMNNKIIDSLPGEAKIYHSAESIVSDDESHVSGLPPHELRLKVGTVVILIRNLNSRKGLCNGTRLIVRQMQENFLVCEILSDRCNGDLVFLPRVNLSPSDTALPFQLKRLQFPVIPAFVITMNRAQGQTYEYVGIILNEPVFSHGQLYVALSRSKYPQNIKIQMEEGPRQGRLLDDDRLFTENVVYKEVFNM